MPVVVSSSIDIAAAPEQVWSVLIDFPAYARDSWNPFIRAIEGEPVVGTRLTVRLAGNGGRGQTFRPTVLAADPDRELRWLGRLGFGGIFDGEHSFVLSLNDDGTTHLVHGERFTGLLVSLLRSATGDAASGFNAFNASLKARVEQ